MLADALGTYAAALIVIVASTAIGSGILAAAGARRWSPTSAVIGLAAAAVTAWWAVRLPGHGLTALLVLVAVAIVAGAVAARSLTGIGQGLRRCWPTAVIALAVVSIPFVADGHFGVLGTGFNVDMSQHLFAADWLADPNGLSPSLIRNGYPLGPHALAVAANEITGELTIAFSAVTIAVPVLLAVTAMAALDSLSRPRAVFVGVLTAVAYLAASYLAQGAFKELFEAAFLLAFALWLRDLTADRNTATGRGGRGLFALLPGAVIAAGALYVYSWPGLAWLLGTLGIWGLVELFRRRDDSWGALRRVLPCALIGLVALAVFAAPEVDRISKFGTSVDAVTERTPKPPGTGLHDRSGETGSGDRNGAGTADYDNSLGNLFGQINPASVFGIWPSGDFRVEPGNGSVPAVVFYLGAVLGALALALGAMAARRQGETALLAALVAAAAIWLAARVGSTPYTAAKALQMLAPVVMLIAARALVDPLSPVPLRDRSRPARRGFTVLVAAFAAGAAISSGLALGNAPVGPDDYTPGVRHLANRFAGQSTLLLAPPNVVADQHGAEFYGWELRGAGEAQVAALEAADGSSPPAGVSRVLVVGGSQAPPFSALKRIGSSNRVVLWRVLDGGQ